MIDAVLGDVLLASALIGLARGGITMVLATLGLLSASVGAVLVVPPILDFILPPEASVLPAGPRRSAAVIVLVIVVALTGLGGGIEIGRRWRDELETKGARLLNAATGGVAGVVAGAIVIWLVGAGFAVAGSHGRPDPTATSMVMAQIRAAIPIDSERLITDVGDALRVEQFPDVFTDDEPQIAAPAGPPNPDTATAGAQIARASVVRVAGTSALCRTQSEGSGFVVAPEQVITNAHVVAGVTSVTVEDPATGIQYEGGVVLFDPQRDVAVVHAPGLPAPPLPRGPELSAGDEASVLGYPLDGPFVASPARVRQRITAVGADLYGNTGVSREIYALFVDLNPGNSGGPVIDTRGRVVGVVFARSTYRSDTGYAITLEHMRDVIRAAPHLRTPVTTGQCLPS